MKGCAEMFSHIKEKTLSAFFVRDFITTSSSIPITPSARLSTARELGDAARRLELEIYIFNPGLHSIKALIHRSRFADLILISPIPQLALTSNSEIIAQTFFEKLACPVLLSPQLPVNYQEIIIFFDSTMSELTALKAFLTLFGHQIKKVPVTVLMVNSLSKPELFLERYFIHFVKTNFDNVGVVPMNGVDIAEELAKWTSRVDSPIVIMGKMAISLLSKGDVVKKMFSKRASIFYSND